MIVAKECLEHSGSIVVCENEKWAGAGIEEDGAQGNDGEVERD